MPSDSLIVSTAHNVATVTLHRPDARNALNAELRSALPATLRELDADDGVSAIILTGTDPA
ncbi:MAG: enoyl-CoA hydratase-related protein, partial [Actinomycetota bacterium]|nr:enoyl-CoA hydratase-related protein [Actinomycetota bacterium]